MKNDRYNERRAKADHKVLLKRMRKVRKGKNKLYKVLYELLEGATTLPICLAEYRDVEDFSDCAEFYEETAELLAFLEDFEFEVRPPQHLRDKLPRK